MNPTTRCEKPMNARVNPRKMAVLPVKRSPRYPPSIVASHHERACADCSWPKREKLRFSSTLISGRISFEKPELYRCFVMWPTMMTAAM